MAVKSTCTYNCVMATSQPLDKRLNYRLNRISHRWSSMVIATARARHKLNPYAMKILSVIDCYQPVTPTELMERTFSDSPKVARAIGYLTEQVLIERVPDPMDGRRALLRTTAKGTRVMADIDKLSNLVEQQVTSVLSDTELEAFNRTLERLETAIELQLRDSHPRYVPAGKD